MKMDVFIGLGASRRSFIMTGRLLKQAKFILVPLLVLGTCLLFTYASFNAAQVATDKNVESYLDFRVREAIQLLQSRITAYETVLHGAGGLFKASEEITRDEFKHYIATLHLADNYPGIQGVGFSVFIPSKEKDNHTATLRSQGFPAYSIYPEGEREAYSSIIYLEPFSERNLRAFGYDMFSESTRHAAMQKAVDKDQISVSGKVRLVQESGKNEQAGFLMYYPIYKNDKPSTLLSERRENLIGWVYAVFRMNDFMHGIHGELADDLDVEIFDAEVISPATLMFDSDGSVHSEERLSSPNERIVSIPVGDHFWTIRIRPLSLIKLRTNADKPHLVAVIGVVFSLTLTFIVYLLMSGRALAITAAKKMNIELINEQLRLSGIIEGTNVGTWEWNVQSGVTVLNERWAQIMGYSLSELKPTTVATWIKYAHPDDIKKSDDLLEQHFSGELSYHECEVRMRHKNGEWVWVLSRAKVATWTAEGKPLLMFGTHQDISNQKQIEMKLLHKSQHDELTGLPNRVLLSDRLQQALLLGSRSKENLAVIFIDLDAFKPVNDTLGHDIGDLVITEVALRISHCVRESDTVARVGGDEFVVLLPAVGVEQNVSVVAEKIRQALNRPFELAGNCLNISSSIGVAIYPEHGEKEGVLVRNADAAMYAAKNRGGNNVQIYNASMQQSTDEMG
ncbi:MAG: diguanylate cyclase (GGDEF)-like protein/PAS domain S-box-containing protein [Motiliproteus sp.]|jgi:diguanylate cyclase (GGDEF)-like protein/PAS domain S-box-containing protein